MLEYRWLCFILCFVISVIFIITCNLGNMSFSITFKNHKEQEKKCRKNTLKNVFVVVNFNYPEYDTMDVLNELYDGVFGGVVSCGQENRNKSARQPDIAFSGESVWYFRYNCLAMGMQMYPNYTGEVKGHKQRLMIPAYAQFSLSIRLCLSTYSLGIRFS